MLNIIKKENIFIRIFLLCATSIALLGCSYIENSNFFNEKKLEDQKNKTLLIEEAIKEEPILKEMDNLCNDLSKPPDFKLEYKNKSSYKKKVDRKYFIVHHYSSSQTYDETRRFFVDSLKSDGWEIEDDIDIGGKWINFVKNSRKIQIYYGATDRNDSGKFIYGITCESLQVQNL